MGGGSSDAHVNMFQGIFLMYPMYYAGIYLRFIVKSDFSNFQLLKNVNGQRYVFQSHNNK